MKYRLLNYIGCPSCLSDLDVLGEGIEDIRVSGVLNIKPCVNRCAYSEKHSRHKLHKCIECIGLEIISGTLKCRDCAKEYRINKGVPRLICDKETAKKASRSKESFGFLWKFDWHKHSKPKSDEYKEKTLYHLDKVIDHIGDKPEASLWLDAGCGNGNDLMMVNQLYKDIEAIGADITDDGSSKSYERTYDFPLTHIIQADLEHLPVGGQTFDFVYSYGVLHHIPNPGKGLKRLVKSLKPGGGICLYLYEDFKDRGLIARIALKLVNSLRFITTRLPNRVLLSLCFVISPFTYLFLTVPANVISFFPKGGTLAKRIPYHHGRSPFDVVPDLYDRFSAPVEYRYNRDTIRGLFGESGINKKINFAQERGWIAWTTKD